MENDFDLASHLQLILIFARRGELAEGLNAVHQIGGAALSETVFLFGHHHLRFDGLCGNLELLVIHIVHLARLPHESRCRSIDDRRAHAALAIELFHLILLLHESLVVVTLIAAAVGVKVRRHGAMVHRLERQIVGLRTEFLQDQA